MIVRHFRNFKSGANFSESASASTSGAMAPDKEQPEYEKPEQQTSANVV
jgi:hypothetical protein